jgi:hypothetical protein
MKGGDVGVAKTACILKEGEGRQWHGGGGTGSCRKGVMVSAHVVFQVREGKGTLPVADACLAFQAREERGRQGCGGSVSRERYGGGIASRTSSEEEESVVVSDLLAVRS